jgi:hypothetical protein
VPFRLPEHSVKAQSNEGARTLSPYRSRVLVVFYQKTVYKRKPIRENQLACEPILLLPNLGIDVLLNRIRVDRLADGAPLYFQEWKDCNRQEDEERTVPLAEWVRVMTTRCEGHDDTHQCQGFNFRRSILRNYRQELVLSLVLSFALFAKNWGSGAV